MFPTKSKNITNIFLFYAPGLRLIDPESNLDQETRPLQKSDPDPIPKENPDPKST